MDTSQHLSPANAVIVQWVHKVAMVEGMKVIHGLSSMTLHLPRQIWLLPLLSAKSACNRDLHWLPNMALFPGVISQLPDGRLIILDLSIIERAELCPHWNRCLLQIWTDMGLPILHTMFLPRLPSMDSSTVMVLVNHSIADKVQQWAHTHGLHWS